MLPKEHLSPSQIKMFQKCPKQYYYRYVEKLKIAPVWAMILGSSGHEAMEYNNRQKIETKQDLKSKEVLEYFVSRFNENIEQDIDWQEEKPGKVKDKGVRSLKFYFDNKAGEHIIPQAVEEEVDVTFDGVPYTLKCILDVITVDKAVRDYKFSRRKPNINFLKNDIQMTAYGLAYFKKYGEMPRETSFEHLVHTKKPNAVSSPIQKKDEDYMQFVEDMKNTGDAISIMNEKGIWYRNSSGWWCSAKNCGYWNKCKPQHDTSFWDFVKNENKKEGVKANDKQQ